MGPLDAIAWVYRTGKYVHHTYLNQLRRQRALKRRNYRKRRQSSSCESEIRSVRRRKRRPVTPPVSRSSTSSSSSSSSSESDRSYHHRRSSSRHNHSSHGSTAVRHNQSDRSDKFYSPRPVSSPSNRPTFPCKCGERYGSRKALIHHTIQNHEADVPCFACNQTIPSLQELMEHIKTEHEKALIVCVYCKSVFGKANDMTENQWKRLKTHMYGELVYAKLAEMQE
ncbi:Zinc finger C2H2 type [Trichostrongylus colubriformis]|uniref:Zinc finger C2H2 type n=1 Tax=Trichostrongylus colubriformis TaxID=6319 RepID=A0AAN8FLH0_TRICO